MNFFVGVPKVHVFCCGAICGFCTELRRDVTGLMREYKLIDYTSSSYLLNGPPGCEEDLLPQ